MHIQTKEQKLSGNECLVREAPRLGRQKATISFLGTKEAYHHRVSKIRVIETHISWVFLTGLYAYKVKKELKFGKILDFSTLKLRRKYCEKEVALNRILCGRMYKGVLKIVRSSSNKRLEMTGLEDGRRALEYCVKMQEIPQRFRMDNLLAAGRVNERTIARLASVLARFHRCTPTNPRIQRFGQPYFMKIKVNENFETISNLGIKVDPKYHDRLTSFIDNNRRLFSQRIEAGKVRDIHGDLYLRNIFIRNNRFYLYDRIEFNGTLRYADIAEDIAHLAMDLDWHGRSDYRKQFISQYILNSGDSELESIIYFMMCYKACMRAKVSFFNAKGMSNKKKRIASMKEGYRLLNLAESYLPAF